jgi:hypothetical protein
MKLMTTIDTQCGKYKNNKSCEEAIEDYNTMLKYYSIFQSIKL